MQDQDSYDAIELQILDTNRKCNNRRLKKQSQNESI